MRVNVSHAFGKYRVTVRVDRDGDTVIETSLTALYMTEASTRRLIAAIQKVRAAHAPDGKVSR